MSLFKHDGSTGHEMRLIRTVGIISSITRNNPRIRGALKNQKKIPTFTRYRVNSNGIRFAAAA